MRSRRGVHALAARGRDGTFMALRLYAETILCLWVVSITCFWGGKVRILKINQELVPQVRFASNEKGDARWKRMFGNLYFGSSLSILDAG